MTRTIVSILVFFLGGFTSMYAPKSAPKSSPKMSDPKQEGEAPKELGNFSVSLKVKDLAASRAFYEKLGLRVCAGDAKRGWLVLQNETANIGLFQGMLGKNTLTFNPGWDREKNTLPKFEDVRDIQKELKKKGIKIDTEADESSTGTAFLILHDPDGNPIYIDQHVPKPGK